MTMLDPGMDVAALDDDGPTHHHRVGLTGEQYRLGLTAEAVITAAYVNGTPLTALCGHRFVPSRDARLLPLCPACKRLDATVH